MIQDDAELERTREALGWLEAALASLRSRPMHPGRLQMMAEGYLEYIDMFKARIQAYENAHATLPR